MAVMMNRRQMLDMMGAGFGALGLRGLAGAASVGDPLSPKATHFQPKVKRVINLFLNGGPSQVDTFDPKPMLDKYHGKPVPSGNLRTERKTGNLLKSPFSFSKYGQSGIEVSEIFPQLGSCIDDVCVIRSMFTDRPNHEASLFMQNCGDKMPGKPSMGSWLTYGLGSENANLPGYVVLCPGLPILGHPLWSSTFLPAVYQGTYLNTQEKDSDQLIQDIRNKSLSPAAQREELDLLAAMNRDHMRQQGGDPQLEASIQAAEIAFRMQAAAPEAFDITKETEK